jgi:hypothetical protein
MGTAAAAGTARGVLCGDKAWRSNRGSGTVIRGCMMRMGMRPAGCDPVPDHEQKQRALGYLWEAWAEARLDGVDEDCLAQASLFTALAELVSTYGEDAAARYAEGLPSRIRNGEFSIDLRRQ